MAETIQQTQIALELRRIADAKNTLAVKAGQMGLVYTDPEEGGSTLITTDHLIGQIASAYEDIEFYNQSDAEHTGHNIVGRTVNLSEGFYTEQSVSVKAGEVPAPSITIDRNSGAITASVTPEEGYVSGVTKSNSTGFDEIAEEVGLTPDNIKAGITVFGISGTFTEDATVPATGSGDVLESDHISEGYTAYKNGRMVRGTMTNFDAKERYNNFNPLEDESYVVCDSPTRYRSLTIGLSNHLLEALQAI